MKTKIADLVNNKKRQETIIKHDFDQIADNNEIIVGKTKRVIDVLKAYDILKKDQAELIKLKLATQAYNLGVSLAALPKDNIATVIYELSALKELKNFLTGKRLKRRHGKLTNGSGGVDRYESILNDYWIHKEIESLDKKIEEKENKLTELNRVEVDVDFTMLDLPF